MIVDIELCGIKVRVESDSLLIEPLNKLELEDCKVGSHNDKEVDLYYLVNLEASLGFKSKGDLRFRWLSASIKKMKEGCYEVTGYFPPGFVTPLCKMVSGDAKSPAQQFSHIFLYRFVLPQVIKKAHEKYNAFIVHAAGVEIYGRTFIFAGLSDVGKTRTVFDLIGRYGDDVKIYGDDYIFVRDGHLYPLPKSFGIRGYHDVNLQNEGVFDFCHTILHKNMLSHVSQHGLEHFRRSRRPSEVSCVASPLPVENLIWIEGRGDESSYDIENAALSMRDIVEEEFSVHMAGEYWMSESPEFSSWINRYLKEYVEFFKSAFSSCELNKAAMSKEENGAMKIVSEVLEKKEMSENIEGESLKAGGH